MRMSGRARRVLLLHGSLPSASFSAYFLPVPGAHVCRFSSASVFSCRDRGPLFASLLFPSADGKVRVLRHKRTHAVSK